MNEYIFKKYENDFFNKTPFDGWTEEERKEVLKARESLFILSALNHKKALYIAKEALEKIENYWLDNEEK